MRDSLGGRVHYQRRWDEHWIGFAEGWAGLRREPGTGWQRDMGAVLGLRREM